MVVCFIFGGYFSTLHNMCNGITKRAVWNIKSSKQYTLNLVVTVWTFKFYEKQCASEENPLPQTAAGELNKTCVPKLVFGLCWRACWVKLGRLNVYN